MSYVGVSCYVTAVHMSPKLFKFQIVNCEKITVGMFTNTDCSKGTKSCTYKFILKEAK